jgi:hypothetical protein
MSFLTDPFGTPISGLPISKEVKLTETPVIDKVTPQNYNPNKSIAEPAIESKIDPKIINQTMMTMPEVPTDINQKTPSIDNMNLDRLLGISRHDLPQGTEKLPSSLIYTDPEKDETSMYKLDIIRGVNQENVKKLQNIKSSINQNKPANSFKGVDSTYIYSPAEIFKKVSMLMSDVDFNTPALIGTDDKGNLRPGSRLLLAREKFNALDPNTLNPLDPNVQDIVNNLKYEYYNSAEKMKKLLYAKYPDQVEGIPIYKILDGDMKNLEVLSTIYKKSGVDIHEYAQDRAEQSDISMNYINVKDKPSYNAKNELLNGKYANIWNSFLTNMESVDNPDNKLVVAQLRQDGKKPYLTQNEKNAITNYMSKYAQPVKDAFDSLVNSGISKTKAHDYLGPLMDMIDIDQLKFKTAYDDLTENITIPKINFEGFNLDFSSAATASLLPDSQKKIEYFIDKNQPPQYEKDGIKYLNNYYKKNDYQYYEGSKQTLPQIPNIETEASYAKPSYSFIQKQR